MNKLLSRLDRGEALKEEDWLSLLTHRSPETDEAIRQKAEETCLRHYGNRVYVRALLEISNFCKNDCLYCGIRRSNGKAVRYRLSEEEILSCAEEGAALGFSTFVLQGGEDPYFTDGRLCRLVEKLKRRYPEKAVTLSLGERSYESYRRLREAGADRYLLRHETADCAHYRKLHPEEMSLSSRMDCLLSLRELGYQVGCGMMVGSPFQTPEHLAKDLFFLAAFQPQMCGLGPFIPHRDTPFAAAPPGSVELSLFLLSLVRLSCPGVLLPATTALATLQKGARAQAMRHGANVVMPNLSPERAKENYSLYNNKLSSGAEAARGLDLLKQELSSVGRQVVMSRGDAKEKEV